MAMVVNISIGLKVVVATVLAAYVSSLTPNIETREVDFNRAMAVLVNGGIMVLTA